MIEIIRGLVRPTTTWAFAIASIAFAAVQLWRGESIEWFIGLAGIVIGFWFQERTETRRNNG